MVLFFSRTMLFLGSRLGYRIKFLWLFKILGSEDHLYYSGGLLKHMCFQMLFGLVLETFFTETVLESLLSLLCCGLKQKGVEVTVDTQVDALIEANHTLYGTVTSLYTESKRNLVEAIREAVKTGRPVETAFSRKRGFRNKIEKRATELSVLCGNSVVFVCYTPDDDKVHVFPENRREIQDIVSKFKNQSDEKRKKNSRDVYDYPNLDGLSADELRNHLSVINAQLSGVRQMKRELVSEKINSEQRGSGQLGFVSDLGCCADGVGVSGTEADSSPLELGFQASEPTAVAYSPSGFCGGDCIWDSSRLDLEFFVRHFTFDLYALVYIGLTMLAAIRMELMTPPSDEGCIVVPS
ncbi:unnamed protein product [Thlaspi arvense]|uniref:MADS-box domain-containing protein n=1 Tax=Thlaspi arvense TaxID=13288 RepID=A0AAU9RPL0_THLAR|nr:unnamed protein product [Thlaspi arvense]